ncbi:hypothetical protein PSTT_01437 [Puccinia striiformis]|uniref:Uncharacterized protein n=2 Tax=Puccinia striiformis TaxID=27350 RepID=A0A0L0VQW4_9BASI|nr:hypothetical protein PSTG_05104 [Puccinia striiformis f. sp. tritici PST-78]POW16311.1 hypothetical protein PSTT_01437 [Puccinia striiformis]
MASHESHHHLCELTQPPRPSFPHPIPSPGRTHFISASAKFLSFALTSQSLFSLEYRRTSPS